MSTIQTPQRTLATAQLDPALTELLDRELEWDPIARGGFNSHLSMSLVAARRLGATDGELRTMFDEQTSDGFLVRRDTPEWLASDVAEIERLGIDAVVRRELPTLLDAPLAQFFHAVIRLELAIDAAHPGQVANALHHLRDHTHPLPDPPHGDGGESFAAVVAALRSHPDRRAGSMSRIRSVAGEPWFRDTLARLRADDALLDDVASSVVAAHVQAGDFTSLHLVTGTRAVRALAEHLSPDDRRHLALRAAQAVAVVDTVLLDVEPDGRHAPTASSSRSWEEIGRAAIDTHDPHVVKLAYAARLEEAATADPRYRFVAAREAGLER